MSQRRLLRIGLCAMTIMFTDLGRSASPPEGASISVVDFRDLPLGQAARIFSDQTGMNVVPSVEAAKVSVSLYLTDVRAKDALQALCRAYDLWFREEPGSNIVRIHTSAEYQWNLGSFREEKTEVFTLRYPNAYDMARSIKQLFGDRVRLDLDERDNHTTDELQNRFDRFDIVDGRSQGLGVTEGAGQNTTNTTNGNNNYNGSGRGNSSGTSVVSSNIMRPVNTSRANSASTASVLPHLNGINGEDVQVLESTPEGERARVLQQLAERGVDIYVDVISRLNKVVVRTSDTNTMEQIRDLIARLDVPTASVLLDCKIYSVQLNKNFHSAVEYMFNNGTVQAGFTTNAIQANGLSFQVMTKNFQAQLQILEQKGQARLVSAPNLFVANNEVSRLFVGEERPLNRSFNGPQTVVGNSTVVSPGSTSIEFRPVGTTLLLTPNINADGSVTLRLLQENSNILTNGANVLVPNNNGFTSQSVDIVQAKSVSGTFVAKDRVPVVIGGLIETSLTDARSQVPFFGDIPVLGYLFGSRDHAKTRNELVLIITPRLVEPKEGGMKATNELLEAEEVRIVEQARAAQAINTKLRREMPAPVPRATFVATPVPRATPSPAPRPRKGK